MDAALALRKFAGRALRRTLFTLTSHRPVKSIRVLAYHSVDDSGSTLSIAPDELRNQLAILRKDGWRTLSAAEYLERLSGGTGGAREVYLTFDDGYENFYEVAAPLLLEFGCRATVFIPTDFIGGRPEWFERDRLQITSFLKQFHFSPADLDALERMMQESSQRRLMSAAQIRELQRSGFDFHSHSAGHHFLTSLTPDELRRDLLRSRSAFADLGIDTPLLCYPYGDSNRDVAAVAQELGFRAAFNAVYTVDSAGPYFISRIGVTGSEDEFQFRFAMSAALDRYYALTGSGRST